MQNALLQTEDIMAREGTLLTGCALCVYVWLMRVWKAHREKHLGRLKCACLRKAHGSTQRGRPGARR